MGRWTRAEARELALQIRLYGSDRVKDQLAELEKIGADTAGEIQKDFEKAANATIAWGYKAQQVGRTLTQNLTIPITVMAAAAVKLTSDVLASDEAIARMSAEGQVNARALQGAVTEMKDEWAAFRTTVAEAVIPTLHEAVEVITDDVLPVLGETAIAWGKQSDEAKRAQLAVLAVVATAGPMISWSASIVTAIAAAKIAFYGLQVAALAAWAPIALLVGAGALIGWEGYEAFTRDAEGRAAAERRGSQTRGYGTDYDAGAGLAGIAPNLLARGFGIEERRQGRAVPLPPRTYTYEQWGQLSLEQRAEILQSGRFRGFGMERPAGGGGARRDAEEAVEEVTRAMIQAAMKAATMAVEMAVVTAQAKAARAAWEPAAGRFMGMRRDEIIDPRRADITGQIAGLQRRREERLWWGQWDTGDGGRRGLGGWGPDQWAGLAGAMGGAYATGGTRGAITAGLPMLGAAFGPWGALAGGLLGGLFGRRRRPEPILEPIPVKVMNWNDMASSLLNVTKGLITAGVSRGIDQLTERLRMKELQVGVPY